MNKEQRIVAVTGGASGIGRACCQVLAKKGWKVVVLDIDAHSAKIVAGEIDGVSAALDVGDEIAVSVVAERIERDVGSVLRAGQLRGHPGVAGAAGTTVDG